jgi:hypothetical protein
MIGRGLCFATISPADCKMLNVGESAFDNRSKSESIWIPANSHHVAGLLMAAPQIRDAVVAPGHRSLRVSGSLVVLRGTCLVR